MPESGLAVLLPEDPHHRARKPRLTDDRQVIPAADESPAEIERDPQLIDTGAAEGKARSRFESHAAHGAEAPHSQEETQLATEGRGLAASADSWGRVEKGRRLDSKSLPRRHRRRRCDRHDCRGKRRRRTDGRHRGDRWRGL